MNLKKVILIITMVAIVLVLAFAILNVKSKKNINNDKINIVASNFASYDFVRAIVGENKDVEVTFLLGAGKDTHSSDPTASDIIKIQESDMFIYIGGEMEKWADKVISTLDNSKTKVICIAESVDTIEEQEVDGAEEEEEEEGAFDEHIWTSPENAVKMVSYLEKEIESIDSSNEELYRKNSEEYIEKINEVDKKIQEIVDNKKRKRLVFADKMPMQYFINYYGLEVTAAFPGCSTETEPSASTIAYIENKVKEEKIPVILYIELNDGHVAQVIANETGSQAMQIQTLHNVSKDDFESEQTWVSLMERNINVLKQALN